MLILVASSKPHSWHRVKAVLEHRFAISYSVDLKGTLAVIQRHRPALVILWSDLLDADLDTSLRSIRQHARESRVLVVMEGGRASSEAPPEGCADACLDERQVRDALLGTIRSLLESQDQTPAARCDHETAMPGAKLDTYRRMVIGKSREVLQLIQTAGRVAATDVNVLITGESGTGKEVLARWIHCSSHRARGPFEAIDLPSVPDDLFESILFGHERGAFTGATGANPGSFKRAHRGTLFLDEISSLKLDLQPKLLRAIQEKEVRSVGAREPTFCDVRVIAATNTRLEDAVGRGAFRSDLYYRLNVVTLHLVPLRRRKEDIPSLLDLFIERYARKFNCRAAEISAEAQRALREHDWPGNIRELENRVQRALLLSSSDQLGPDDFFEKQDVDDEPSSAVHFPDCNRSLAEIERLYISWVLSETNGNQSQAAQILQIDRKTLRNKLRGYSAAIQGATPSEQSCDSEQGSEDVAVLRAVFRSG
ncbi:MAG: sigma-54-dependent Fis family transcriptional regulator [Deltaproteobacteria bacterium]|nr:sigma-54-dependent Fis family transcriptional regulator [Deltaproteobacteria bacterium]